MILFFFNLAVSFILICLTAWTIL